MECAASRVALGIFSLHHGRLRLVRHAEEKLPVSAGAEDRWMEHTQAALLTLGRKVRVPGPVTLVLPPHLVLTKMTRLPPVEPAKRAQVLRFEAEQGIPQSLAEVVWDTVVSAESEAAVDVMLAAAKRGPVEALCAAMRAAGFRPRIVLPSSLATLAAFRLVHGESPASTLLINLGARSTTIQWVESERFLVRTLALGVQDSQWLAAEAGETCDKLATRLGQEITRTRLYFRRQDSPANFARIVMAGGGAKLAGLGEALSEKVKVPVASLGLSPTIESDCGVVSDDSKERAVGLTELAGAAATQFFPGQPVLNLLPLALRQQASRRRRRQRWLVGAALLAVGAGWPLMTVRAPAGSPRPVAAAVVRDGIPPPARPGPEAVIVNDNANLERHPAPVAPELLETKSEPLRLQLAGYFGGPGDYTVAFVTPGRSETLLARIGGRIGELGVVLRGFEVRKIMTTDRKGRPADDSAAVAVLHVEETGGEVVLDSRERAPVDARTAPGGDSP